ncbi:M48 family metallopeptidase [Psychromonas arctica]|uniref:M48 family metallopeptidase n=1 Tax=Psychromonas arctica TaxID=168275 RepID=UPI000416B9FD|nr:SprT family zinc-dependent metalloprotease [Psychromonas arctica]
MTSVNSNERNKELYSFIYGEQAIAYEVIRKSFAEDKKKKITIRVHPDCEVIVTAPECSNNTDIHDAVIKRAKWIWDAVCEFQTHQEYVQNKNYVSGEMQFYLGRRYMLKVVKDNNSSSSVKLLRGKLLVSLTKFDENKTELVKVLVGKWYKHKAQRVFQERINDLLPQTNWVIDPPSFKVLSMQKQWGSCSAQGSLMLNPHLVKAPKECIDYVILHELCHIAEHNHSERFWRLLTQVMPHWKKVKSRLDGMAELYLNE